MKKIFFIFIVLQALLLFALAVTPSFASAITLFNPLGSITEPGPFVQRAASGFAAMIGTLAIAFVVFNGFKMVISRGNEESVEKAKTGLQWAVGGFIVALLSFTIINGTAQFLGFSQPNAGSPDLQSPLQGIAGNRDDFTVVLVFIMTRFLEIMGVAAILMVIYYGFRYIASRGNEEEIERAKKGLQWSLLGFAISLLSYTIINTIQRFFGTDAP